MTFKRNGVKEWIFQRFSNVLILVFSAVYLGLILTMPELNYGSWVAMHQAMWFKVFASFTLVVVMLNSVLAGWQIGTDYTQKVPVPGFSFVFHSFYLLVSAAFLLFGLYILWA